MVRLPVLLMTKLSSRPPRLALASEISLRLRRTVLQREMALSLRAEAEAAVIEAVASAEVVVVATEVEEAEAVASTDQELLSTPMLMATQSSREKEARDSLSEASPERMVILTIDRMAPARAEEVTRRVVTARATGVLRMTRSTRRRVRRPKRRRPRRLLKRRRSQRLSTLRRSLATLLRTSSLTSLMVPPRRAERLRVSRTRTPRPTVRLRKNNPPFLPLSKLQAPALLPTLTSTELISASLLLLMMMFLPVAEVVEAAATRRAVKEVAEDRMPELP